MLLSFQITRTFGEYGLALPIAVKLFIYVVKPLFVDPSDLYVSINEGNEVCFIRRYTYKLQIFLHYLLEILTWLSLREGNTKNSMSSLC